MVNTPEEILKLIKPFEAQYKSKLEKTHSPAPVVLKFNETILPNTGRTYDVECICPNCGRHETNFDYTFQNTVCSCGYQFPSLYDIGHRAVYELNVEKEENFLSTFVHLDIDGCGSKALMKTENTIRYEYVNGIVNVSTTIKPIALGYVELDKKVVFLLENGKWVKKNVAFNPTFSRQSYIGITFGQGPVSCGGWVKHIVDQAYPTKAPKTKAKMPNIPVAQFEAADIDDFMVSIYNRNGIKNTIQGQAWCTDCDEVFDFDETLRGRSNFVVTCPHCGKSKEYRDYGIDTKRLVTADVVKNGNEEFIVLVSYRVCINSDWSFSTEPNYAALVNCKNGNTSIMQLENGVWQETKNAVGFKTSYLVFKVDSALDKCNFSRIEEMFADCPAYFGVKFRDIAKCFGILYRNRDVAEMMKYKRFALNLFKTLFVKDQKGNENFRQNGFEKIFGVKRTLYETACNMPDDISFTLTDLQEINDINGMTEYALKFILSNAKGGFITWISEIMELLTGPVSIDNVIQYLNNVDAEQGISVYDGAEFWNRYLTAYHEMGKSCDEYPENLASDMYRAERQAES